MEWYNMGPLWLAPFFIIMLFKVYPCCSPYQYFLSFYCQIKFFVWLYHILLIYSSVDDHLSCFHFFGYWNWCGYSCTRFCVKISFQWSWVYRKECNIWVNLCLTFWWTAKLFSKMAAPFYKTTSNAGVFPLFNILTMTRYFLSFVYYPL